MHSDHQDLSKNKIPIKKEYVFDLLQRFEISLCAEIKTMQTHINLNELAQRVHAANQKWWHSPQTGERLNRNIGEMLMLSITELAEACEGERKNLMDDKIKHRKMAEVEMADAFIRLLDFSAGTNITLRHYESNSLDLPDNKAHALLVITGSIVRSYASPTYVSEAIAFIQIYCMKHSYDLMGAFEDKMVFNATREDHTHEARRAAEGKQF